MESNKEAGGMIIAYALVNNYHTRKKIPEGIFATEDRAEGYLMPIIAGHEQRGENYDYDIEEIIIDPLLFGTLAAVDKERSASE